MKNFWKYAALLMTAAAAGGMLTSCQDKTEPEEDPVTIKKVWLMKLPESETASVGYEVYTGLDFGLIDGSFHFIESYAESEEFRNKMKESLGVELSEYEIPYMIPPYSGEANFEITETDATSGTITVSDEEMTYYQLSYKNLTKDSVVITGEAAGETSPELEFRTPESLGLTVAGYVDITPYLYSEDEQ